MKYKLIKETDKIKLINGKRINKRKVLGPANDFILESDILKTKIFTDGQIKAIEEIPLSQLELPKKLRDIEIDKYELSELELTNHKFVISVFTALEFQRIGSVRGWFNIIKDVEVYLRDKKDKEAIKKVKNN